MNKNLFTPGIVKLASGAISSFKIECDALTNKDWECLAYIISSKYKFKKVYGVPRGGLNLATELEKYRIDDNNLPSLIVDDVLTTGKSIEKFRTVVTERYREDINIIGVVVFNRGVDINWIDSIFKMWN